MKKIILPLLVLVAASAFSSKGNANENPTANELLGQLKGIFCDYRGSQAYYNLVSKKYTFSGRTSDDVYPIFEAKADDGKKTITITVLYPGRTSESVFTIKGKPYKTGLPGDDSTKVSIGSGNTDCMGYLQ